MTGTRFRAGAAWVAGAVTVTAVTATACAVPSRDPADAAAAGAAAATGSATVTSATPDARTPTPTGPERAFLDDLVDSGLPADLTSETSVEVGIGICRSLDDGVGQDVILNRLRPLTTAIAAQSPDRDTAEVGRALVRASRTHLCP